MKLKQTEADAIRERMKDYPVQAQADIERLLSICTERQKRTITRAEYSPEFESIWKTYPKPTGKAEAYKSLLARVADSGYTEAQLLGALRAYVIEQQKKKTETKYYLMMSSFFGANTRRYEDYIGTAVSDPTTERDWWSSAGKLIRDMNITDRAIHGVPYPLPIELDFSKGFGE